MRMLNQRRSAFRPVRTTEGPQIEPGVAGSWVPIADAGKELLRTETLTLGIWGKERLGMQRMLNLRFAGRWFALSLKGHADLPSSSNSIYLTFSWELQALESLFPEFWLFISDSESLNRSRIWQLPVSLSSGGDIFNSCE